MDLKTFGRHLADVLAERTLNVIRSTNVAELRQAVQGATPESRMLSSVAMGLGVFALGAHEDEPRRAGLPVTPASGYPGGAPAS